MENKTRNNLRRKASSSAPSYTIFLEYSHYSENHRPKYSLLVTQILAIILTFFPSFPDSWLWPPPMALTHQLTCFISIYIVLSSFSFSHKWALTNVTLDTPYFEFNFKLTYFINFSANVFSPHSFLTFKFHLLLWIYYFMFILPSIF